MVTGTVLPGVSAGRAEVRRREEEEEGAQGLVQLPGLNFPPWPACGQFQVLYVDCRCFSHALSFSFPLLLLSHLIWEPLSSRNVRAVY